LTPAPGPNLTGDPQAITDEIIARSTAEYQATVAAFIDARAAAADAAAKVNQQQCGMFTAWNAQAGECLLDPTRPGFLILMGLLALGMFMAFGKR
jgi:hypothetical protein